MLYNRHHMTGSEQKFPPCSYEEDLDLCFPIVETGPLAEQQYALAKAVCARCTFRESCLELAFEIGATHGVWGGTTPDERRAMRKDSVLAANAARYAIWLEDNGAQLARQEAELAYMLGITLPDS